MLKRNLTALAVAALLATGAFSANAMSPALSSDVAREAAEGPRGEGKGHPFADVKDVFAREASEGPRGRDNERPGDRHRRGGRLTTDTSDINVIAREASEGPRGGDNERPGDRQRRGGRLS